MKYFQVAILIFCTGFIIIQSKLNAQDTQSNNPEQVGLPDRFVCVSIPTIVNGQEYDKTLKCETKDAICYVMEGFAMSCIPKINTLPTTNTSI
jgi:tetrahydromethanopterin S-methyltransferase subunit H